MRILLGRMFSEVFDQVESCKENVRRNVRSVCLRVVICELIENCRGIR